MRVDVGESNRIEPKWNGLDRIGLDRLDSMFLTGFRFMWIVLFLERR